MPGKIPEEKARRYMKSVHIPVYDFLVKKDGAIHYVAPSFLDAHGFTEGQAGNVTAIFPPLFQKNILKRIKQTVKKGEPTSLLFSSVNRRTNAPVLFGMMARRIEGKKLAHLTLFELPPKADKKLKRNLEEALKYFALGVLHPSILSLESKDPVTQGHSLKVQAVTAGLALALERRGLVKEGGKGLTDLPLEALSDVVDFSAIHDLGKIRVPEAILTKPGRLDEEERRKMDTHALRGKYMVHQVIAGPTLGIFYHHARWDGEGNPSGADSEGKPVRIKGEGIPAYGRVIAVSDVFDALSSARQYKPAWPLDKTLPEIIDKAGTQFDPRFSLAFVRYFDDVLEGTQGHLEKTIGDIEERIKDWEKSHAKEPQTAAIARQENEGTLSLLNTQIELVKNWREKEHPAIRKELLRKVMEKARELKEKGVLSGEFVRRLVRRTEFETI